nr:homeobox protein Hox-B4-like [Equus caballus]
MGSPDSRALEQQKAPVPLWLLPQAGGSAPVREDGPPPCRPAPGLPPPPRPSSASAGPPSGGLGLRPRPTCRRWGQPGCAAWACHPAAARPGLDSKKRAATGTILRIP